VKIIKKIGTFFCISTTLLSTTAMALGIGSCPAGTKMGIAIDRSFGIYGMGLVISRDQFERNAPRFGDKSVNFDPGSIVIDEGKVSLRMSVGNPSKKEIMIEVGSVGVQSADQMPTNTCFNLNLNQKLIVREKVESSKTDCGFFPPWMCRKNFAFVEIATSDDNNWIHSMAFEVKK
jgi:hypothetical protein